jgi:DNA-binding NarL/FixJ family response regulator
MGCMDPLLEKLSDKQRQVLTLLLEGLTVSEIGERMRLSPHSVRTYARNAGEKLAMEPEPEPEQ